MKKKSVRYLSFLQGSFIALSTISVLTFGTLSSAFTQTTPVLLRSLVSLTDGSIPVSQLTQGADGFLYGTTTLNGASNAGTLFRIGTDGSNFAVLHTFGGSGNNDGANGAAGVFQGRDGNFYGTTLMGGSNNLGTLYRFSSPGLGSLNYTILRSFDLTTIGSLPTATLTEDPSGLLWGNTQQGGSTSFGTVFRSDFNGNIALQTVFQGNTDSSNPTTPLLFNPADSFFYGTTTNRGVTSGDVIYRVSSSGNSQRQNVYTFNSTTSGALPTGLTFGPDGNMYGLTNTGGTASGTGGTASVGTFFRFNPSTNAVTVLYNFSPINGTGYNPTGKLLLASDSNFYGTTTLGGSLNSGTIFQITPAGVYTTIYNFLGGVSANSGTPMAGLIQGSDGALYGTAAGTQGQSSTIFRLNLGLPAPTPNILGFTQATASIGSTIGVYGDNFVGASAVSLTSPDGTQIPVTQYQVISKNFMNIVVPAGAISGANKIVVQSSQASIVGTSVATLEISGGTPPVPQLPVLTVGIVTRATSNGAPPAVLRIKRSGNTDMNQPFPVTFKLTPQTTAQPNIDFQFDPRYLTNSNTFTIPAGVKKIKVNMTFLPTSTPPVGTHVKFIWIKITGSGFAYTIDGEKKFKFKLKY